MEEKDNLCVKNLKFSHMYRMSPTKILRNFQDCYDQQLSVLIEAGLGEDRQKFASILGIHQVIM